MLPAPCVADNLLPLFVLLALFSSRHTFHAAAFDFTYGPPTECDSLNVSWSGGRPPFQLLITPLFRPSLNISIPGSSVNSQTQNGTFGTQLPLPAGQKFLLTMSDADGFATGGISNVLETGSSQSGPKCNTTEPNPEFTFQLPSALKQCSQFVFSDYNGSTQPDTILGLIPLGQSFLLTTPKNSDQLVWQTNVQAGTSIVFLMVDSQGRSGGSSDLLTVSQADDSSCLNGTSPHSTASASEQTSGPRETTTVRASPGMQPAAIAGIALGAAALLCFTSLVAFCLLRRRKRKGKDKDDDDFRPPIVQVGSGPSLNNGGNSRLSRMRTSIMVPASRRHTRNLPSVDLLPPVMHSSHPSQSASHYTLGMHPLPPGHEYEPDPFVLPSEASAMDGHSSNATSTDVNAQLSHSSPRTPHSRLTSPRARSDVELPSTGHPQGHSRRPSFPNSSTLDGSSRKASMRYSTPRFILHTDAEDPSALEESEEVVELPPEYTDRRTPPSSRPQSRK